MSATTACRFSSCNWRGSCDDIFTHCEFHHRRCIKNLKAGNYFDFTFNDLCYEAYLLCGKSGLYWFALDQHSDSQPKSDGFKRGVFAIGESDTIDYTLKLGLIRDGHADYLGPFKSRAEVTDLAQSELYDLVFSYAYIQFMYDEMPSHVMRLYIGDYDDSDDQYQPCYKELDWSDASEVAVNQLCLEKFTCGICLEYIRRDARFCELKHFVCLACFDEMVKRRKLKCPICRGDYLYDCHDDKIEELLRMVKFPEQHEEETESQKQLNEQASTSKRLKMNL